MKQSTKWFINHLSKTDLVTVDEGPYLSSWDTDAFTDENFDENQVVRFAWESEGNDYSSILTEAGIAQGTYYPEDGKFVCDDSDGDLTVIRFFKASIVKDEEPIAPVQVKHWDQYDQNDFVHTHHIVIEDNRQAHGQAYVEITAIDGDPDKIMEITLEVNSNPLNRAEPVPCAHIHFDDNELAVSLFKVGNKIVVRPESDVWIEAFRGSVNGIQEELFWIKTEGRS